MIADDATGANDAALKAFLAGERVRVSYFGGIYPRKTGVLVINAGIRNSSGEYARAQMTRLLEDLKLPAGELFIKVDSTLRGNISDEIGALLAYYPKSPVFFAPAYPALGRTVKDGSLLVNGVPVDRTEFAGDALKPVKSARLADIAGIECAMISRAEDEKALLAQIADAEKTGIRVFAFDAEDDADLSRIAALKERCQNAVYVGSAGITGFLYPGAESAESSFFLPSPAVFAVGSVSDVSRAQVENSRGAKKIPVDPCGLLTNAFCISDEDAAEGEDMILYIRADEEAEAAARRAAGELGLSRERVSEVISNSFAELAADLAKKTGARLIFSCGGDITQSIFKRLKIECLDIAGSVDEGVPVLFDPDSGRFFITKAGGFGKKTLINDILASKKFKKQ